MSAPRKKMPRWRDGRRWCPDCRAYISPELFARVAVSRSHPDGYRQYCRAHDLARGRLYRARKAKPTTPRQNQRAYSMAIYSAHGRVPEADRQTAEALHLLGADALYTGAPTRPHAGTIAGLQQNPRYGPLVWMDFSQDPLALDTAVRDTLALIKAGYVELLAGASQEGWAYVPVHRDHRQRWAGPAAALSPRRPGRVQLPGCCQPAVDGSPDR